MQILKINLCKPKQYNYCQINNIKDVSEVNHISFKAYATVKPSESLFKEACRLLNIIYDLKSKRTYVFIDEIDKTAQKTPSKLTESDRYKIKLAGIIKQLQEFHLYDKDDGLEKYFKHFLSEIIKRDFKGFKVKILSCETVRKGKDLISAIMVHAEKGRLFKSDKEDVLYTILNGQIVD